jgi:glutamate N-acetyltransferase/amino-acid N-acetyltransferase
LALASGAASEPASRSELTDALTQVCDELARAMVADGEGAAHVAEIWVRGLASEADARQAARTIATSLLVRTALHGKDPNWGRLLAAAGRCGVRFDPHQARISIGDVEIVRNGVTLGAAAERDAAQVMAGPSYTIELILGNGPGAARYLTSDLGHHYLDLNAGYRS